MMRSPEAQLFENGIRVGDEIAVGEEQKLDEFDDFAFRDIGFGDYVSHIDIFLKLDYG